MNFLLSIPFSMNYDIGWGTRIFIICEFFKDF